MQQGTEFLVVTLAHILPGKDPEALARIRSIVETLRSAPGLVSTHLYRGRASGTIYLLLSTWEDEASWFKAQKRHTPRNLLLAADELLVSRPEQWLMAYTWGYSRPTSPPQLAAAHLMTMPPAQIPLVQHNWLANLRQPTLQSLLTFAFLARGINDTATSNELVATGAPISYSKIFQQQSSVLLSFFSWANEMEREGFYTSVDYQNMQNAAEQAGSMRILPLELL